MIIHVENTNEANIFSVSQSSAEYWKDYLSARPKYSPAFYNKILDYHGEHQQPPPPCSVNDLTLAHDIGTGPGQVAEVLSKHFDQVIASDLNKKHLSLAAHRLGLTSPPNSDLSVKKPHITLVNTSAEEIHTQHPAHSANFLSAAECLPLLDADKALESWAIVLNSGATLAIWFYGRPHFVETPEFDYRACQEMYDRIATKMYEKHVKSTASDGPQKKVGWKRATDAMASFLDNVHLPEEVWTDVLRTKWNSDWSMSFYDEGACDFNVEVSNRVCQSEKVEKVCDRAFWGEEWSVEDWKKFLRVNLPSFQREDISADIKDDWKRLAEIIGGEGVKVRVGWPVVLILATRR
ncbi:hypothetical protein EJ04DRAFT_514882 [Polyplosphaeria fusca]|uniref:Methyltransferase type 11 domain-containing protein n=1 Tax=Polyplosphaeria fusca TaxID=682080 RepID=A0A9P4QT96_9PLEO|nr:hypothetical protein EJ04DRAFT_514882 [Polyplosphaeria fusca]